MKSTEGSPRDENSDYMTTLIEKYSKMFGLEPPYDEPSRKRLVERMREPKMRTHEMSYELRREVGNCMIVGDFAGRDRLLRQNEQPPYGQLWHSYEIEYGHRIDAGSEEGGELAKKLTAPDVVAICL